MHYLPSYIYIYSSVLLELSWILSTFLKLDFVTITCKVEQYDDKIVVYSLGHFGFCGNGGVNNDRYFVMNYNLN